VPPTSAAWSPTFSTDPGGEARSADMTATAEGLSSAKATARSVSQVHKWWASKIAPLLAVTYLALTMKPLPLTDALTRGATMLWSACLLATAAYVVNDWFDREVDRAVGKHSTVMDKSVLTVTSLYAVLVIAAIVPWLVIGLPVSGWVALVAIVVLPLVYSAPPLRWKTRGGLGVLADAGLAHVAPALFALAAFGALDAGFGTDRAAAVASLGAVAWAIGLGLRSIIAHEIVDLEADRASGVETWVGVVGIDRATAFAIRVVMPIEILGLATMAVALAGFTPVPLVALVMTFACLALARSVGAFPVPLLVVSTPDIERPVLFMFYRFWFGTVFLAGLVTVDPAYAAIIPVHLLLFLPIARDEVRSLIAGGNGTIRGCWWVLMGRIVGPVKNWFRWRFPEHTGRMARWIGETASVIGEGIAGGWVVTWGAIAGTATTAAIAVGNAFAAVGRGIAAVGRGIAAVWFQVWRFVWRVYRKIRRTLIRRLRLRS